MPRKNTQSHRRDSLLSLVQRFPTEPGVYLFKNYRGRILYIGKALNLRERVRSYFLARDTRPVIPHLMNEVTDVDCFPTSTEFEALILEAQLIRRHQPRFNTLLKDTRNHPYVKISRTERYPRMEIVFKVRHDSADYFGPFRSIGHARKLLDLVARIFRIRPCSLDLGGGKDYPVCLLYHIRRCSGPCAGHITEQQYALDLEGARALLEGRKDFVVNILTERIRQLSQKQAFEAAAEVRDTLRMLEEWEPQPVVAGSEDLSVDVVGVASRDRKLAWVILQIRRGRLVRRREMVSTLTREDDIKHDEWWEQVLPQFYLGVSDAPDEVWVPHIWHSQPTLEEWFQYHFSRVIRIRDPRHISGNKRKIFQWAKQNAESVLATYLLDSGVPREKILSLVQSRLSLPRYPYRIEGYDISNIQGRWNVGAIVAFEGGSALPSEFRRMKIRTVSGPDDYQSMREVIHRRFTGRLAKSLPLPDLLLIDGGPGQLHAAQEALKGIPLPDLSIVALAKKEETLFLAHASDPLRLSRADPVLKLLQSIRDAAHDTAIRYYRRLHRTQARAWLITQAPGIGNKTAKKIWHHFGSLESLRKASLETLQELLGQTRGTNFFYWLHSQNFATTQSIREEG